MKVAIIGAGASGLCAAKYCLVNKFVTTIYEQTNQIGGTWVYTDQIGKDRNGLDIHTSAYQSLRILFAKDIMGFPDLPIPDGRPESYIPAKDILDYLNQYANIFKLNDHIKYQHYVIRVRPIEDTKWEVIVNHLPKNKLHREIYDAIIICNGHFSVPIIPAYDGQDIYQGRQLHSHDFRTTKSMKDEKVLVIGCGASGMDLTNEISKTASTVTMSHHKEEIKSRFSKNVKFKPDVKRLTINGAEFIDGSTDAFSVILYCTGFQTTFPFLNVNCGICVDENYVQSLYKHIININRPTMAIIGVNNIFPAFHVFDLQIRFLMEFLSGRKHLPSIDEMKRDTEMEMQRRWKKGLKRKQAHILGSDQRVYFDELCQLAEIENIESVVTKIHLECVRELYDDVANFRRFTFKRIDNETFERNELNCDDWLKILENKD